MKAEEYDMGPCPWCEPCQSFHHRNNPSCYIKVAARIAAIFKLKHLPKRPDMWHLGAGYGARTDRELVLTFSELAKQFQAQAYLE